MPDMPELLPSIVVQNYCKSQGLPDDTPAYPKAASKGQAKTSSLTPSKPKPSSSNSCSRGNKKADAQQQNEEDVEGDIEDEGLPYVTRFPSRKEVSTLWW